MILCQFYDKITQFSNDAFQLCVPYFPLCFGIFGQNSANLKKSEADMLGLKYFEIVSLFPY